MQEKLENCIFFRKLYVFSLENCSDKLGEKVVLVIEKEFTNS
jgi:hypothetical protein